MKTKEYVLKYKLNESDKFDHSEFVQDLANDFIVLLELNKAEDNIKGFDNAVRAIKMKFDAINNKTVGQIPEKLWNYFYATVIVKLREELCPADMEKRRFRAEQKRKEWEQRQAYHQENERNWDAFWSRNFFSFLFNKTQPTMPLKSFEILGLQGTANESDVKAAYRTLSLKHHPDRGGKQDKFIEITESKNKCLAWLQEQN